MEMEYTIKIKNIEETQEKIKKINQLVDEINKNSIKVEIVQNELKNMSNVTESLKTEKKKKFACLHCKRTGEYRKQVNYCPYCGKNQSSLDKKSK